MRGTKQWQNRSNKKRSRGSDGEKLDTIMKALTENGLNVIREPVIENDHFSTRNCVRNPDIKVKYGDFVCYVELDGAVHGTLDEPNERTLARDSDFERTKMNQVIISEEDADFYGLPYDKLTVYLVRHELRKHMVRKSFVEEKDKQFFEIKRTRFI